MQKKKNVNSGIFAVFVTILICIAVLVVVLIRGNMESKEKVSSKKTSALHVATPEALDPGFYVQILNEDLSHAENEEEMENY